MSALVTRDKKDRPKPHHQWGSGSVKHSARGQRCLIITRLAFKQFPALYHEILFPLASRASIPVWPANLEKILLAVFVISKPFVETGQSQWALLGHDLLYRRMVS